MEYTEILRACDQLEEEERGRLMEGAGLRTLGAVWACVPDPRSTRGRRYPLTFLLTCVVGGLLCGCNSLAEVGEWCQAQATLLAESFPQQRRHTPCGALFRWLLPQLPVGELEAALAGWVRQSRPRRDHEALALDGKTVRGAQATSGQSVHLLSVSTHQSGETLYQMRVSDKTNEIPVAQALLPLLPLRGRVLTADALHTQVQTARQIVQQRGHYLFALKENQPTLYGDVAFYFADPLATYREVRTLDRRRGRDEERLLRCADTAQATHLRLFPQMRQVLHLRTRVTIRRTRQTSTTDAYFITSCSSSVYDPSALLTLIRGHWSIESRHWLRDVTFGEDRSRLARGHTPQLLATLRSLVYTLIRRFGQRAVAQTRRALAWTPSQAVALLISPLPPSRSLRLIA